jgi:hypothetical protein
MSEGQRELFYKIMKQKIFTLLDRLEIDYTNYEHAPAFTCDDAKGIEIP